MRASLFCILFVIAVRSACLADGMPSWYRAGDAVTVVRTATTRGFSYAVVHDGSLREHATFCVAVGAHIGGRVVIAIRPDGIVLSGGRVLRSAVAPSNDAVAAASPRS